MREKVQPTEERMGQVDIINETEAGKPREARNQGLAAAFMRGMAQDYTKERVEEIMRGQDTGVQAPMEAEEMLQAMEKEESNLIKRTLEMLKGDGHTQKAVREGEKWGMVMLTAEGQDIQAHVWAPARGMSEQSKLLEVVDAWVDMRTICDLHKGTYTGMTVHRTPPEWETYSPGEQAVRVAGNWKYWHVGGKPGLFRLGARGTVEATDEAQMTTRKTRNTEVNPINNGEELGRRTDDRAAFAVAREATGEVEGETGVRCTEKLVQTTLQFRAESAEQASSRLEGERAVAERRRLRPPPNKKADWDTTRVPVQPNKGNDEEVKGSPEARKYITGGSMPKTENLDLEKMRDGQHHTMTFLTWNIQGSRHSLYELEEQMERWDIDVAVISGDKHCERGDKEALQE
ncbi:hypothetical protein CYMTET_47927 [Cymbomonas tetramitiformis]|uniref:Endonuclease/exonuclease/phosphatase domain-containing protein n=1 Tax=Cymbomonas tetramitiformis TaxID=36881 RepID=A0AAE0BV40_9CHLO|nr:hypothetical protein CYMTET_47927 [Cymbomonas tetramitiformis]